MSERGEKPAVSCITTFEALMHRAVQGDSLGEEWPQSAEFSDDRVNALLDQCSILQNYEKDPSCIDLRTTIGIIALLTARAAQTRYSGYYFPQVVWMKHNATLIRYPADGCRTTFEELLSHGIPDGEAFTASMRSIKSLGFERLLFRKTIWLDGEMSDEIIAQRKLLFRFQESVSWWMADLGFSFTPDFLIPSLLDELGELKASWIDLGLYREEPVFPVIDPEHQRKREHFSLELADVFHYAVSIAVAMNVQISKLVSQVPFGELQRATGVPLSMARLRQLERWIISKK